MANVQMKNGYFGVANELWEAISRAKFNGSERSAIDLILRLTYGCKKNGHNGEEAEIDKLSDFEVVGVVRQNISLVLAKLTRKNIIRVSYIRETDDPIQIRFNKNYDTWNVSFATRLKRYARLVKMNVKTANEHITQTNKPITKRNENITPDSVPVNKKVIELLQESNENITPKQAKANDSLASQPPKYIKDINKELINYIEGNQVLALIEKRTGTKYTPQDGPQLQNYNEFIDRFGEDIAIAAINKSLATKATLKGANLIAYAFKVAMNNNDLQTKAMPREKPHEDLRIEFAKCLQSAYNFFNLYDPVFHADFDRLMALNNEAKIIELMAEAKELNLQEKSFDWIAAQIEGQS